MTDIVDEIRLNVRMVERGDYECGDWLLDKLFDAVDEIDALRIANERLSLVWGMVQKNQPVWSDKIAELHRQIIEDADWRASRNKGEYLRQAARENRKLREALRFYADESNWRTRGNPKMGTDVSRIVQDAGGEARWALRDEWENE